MDKKLKIGDEKNAILSLQRTQTDPHKALAEIIENAIDAKAKNIKILRHRHKGEIEVFITDDGEGVKAGSDGNCDMDRIPTSICDSLKRKLAESDRDHVIGEFAIGLLGFSAIGSNLEMVSQTATSKYPMFLRMKSGSVDFESGPVSLSSIEPNCSTTIRIWPIKDGISARLTADKIHKYLGEELAGRIRDTQVKITVEDTVGQRKNILVKPLDFKGDRISDLERVESPQGHIKVRFYVAQQCDIGKISVCKKGTKVLDSITEIAELNHAPWNNPLLEGVVDSRFINIPPATRKGIVPDDNLYELINSLKSIEGKLINILKEVEIRRSEKIDLDIFRSVKSIFIEAVGSLPEEYLWFDKKGKIKIPGGIVKTNDSPKELKTKIANGPMESVTITPAYQSQINPAEKKKFIAKAWTKKNELIPIGIDYQWKISIGIYGRIVESSGPECSFQADNNQGELFITVTATQGSKIIQASTKILILRKSASENKGLNGFPIPTPMDLPGENWRSRMNPANGNIDLNVGHKDCKLAQKKGKRTFIKYLLFLYAKELVLHNFKDSGENVVLERILEVLTSIEIRGKIE